MYSAELKEVSDKSAIPDPKGYKILIAVPTAEKTTAGGIHLPDNYLKLEEVASIFGYVVAMGDTAYKDEAKFASGPWCKVGDWVVFRSYSGTRLKIDEQEFRLINDDQVEATVESPRNIKRAF